jgi:hypothetical protein
VDAAPLNELLEAEGIRMEPLFGVGEKRMRVRAESLERETGEAMPDLAAFYHVDAPDDRLEDLVERFQEIDAVEGAYVKPPSYPPIWLGDEDEALEEEMQPTGAESPIATPDFTPKQIYLNAAPEGIDARYAWTLPGGRGEGVKVIDCEWGWNFTHEDLLNNSTGVVVGTGSSDDDHGTAVVGEIGGDRNTFGVTGIAPYAQVGGAAFGATAPTIRAAADKLGPGDIILLEVHRWGPNSTGAGQFGFIAVEWWPDDLLAIRYAVNKGIIVVEAAGNGYQDLDAAVYETKPAGFPAWWKNPFNPSNPTSGAVVVGAGAPPPGTNDKDHGPDRSRLPFSNYGARVDCQGWGREVVTTGYGNLQDGPNRNEWYMRSFSGTSSASPIVVGALACTQGVLRAQGGTLLNSAKARDLVRATGSPQQDGPGRPRSQRIGNRPDLRKMIPAEGDAWLYNKTVVRTHAKHGSQMVWAMLAGGTWMRVRPGAPDGVSNVFEILCAALANSRKVDVYVRAGQIEQATLR